MNNWEAAYQKWLQNVRLEDRHQEELLLLTDHNEAIKDAFHSYLEYTNSGMTAVQGPGINRMNTYTVHRAVKGLIGYIQLHTVNYQDRGVVIAYDSKSLSKSFAEECAKVLGAYGIKSYLFSKSLPSSLLSFAVRYLGAVTGIMLSADNNHEDAKCSVVFYNEYGSQLTEAEAGKVAEKVNQITELFDIRTLEMDSLIQSNLFEWINGEVENAYIEQLVTISKLDKAEAEMSLKIAVISENSDTRYIVKEGLQRLGFSHVVSAVSVKSSQAKSGSDIIVTLDDNGLTVKVKNRHDNKFTLDEEQLGILLLDFCLSHTDRQVLESARVVKSSKAMEIGKVISEHYNVAVVETKPGFQHIDEQINLFDETGETFIFGLGENNEYLIDSFVRDKDFIQTAIITCEMTEYWKSRHKTLDEALDILTKDYKTK